jgi:hypothetical protein
VTVITDPFGFKARREAEALGMGDVPMIVLPHTWQNQIPIGQLPDDLMRKIAEASYEEIDFILTNVADEVAKAYREAVAPQSVRLGVLEGV